MKTARTLLRTKSAVTKIIELTSESRLFAGLLLRPLSNIFETRRRAQPSIPAVTTRLRTYANKACLPDLLRRKNPLLQIFDIKRLQFDITTHRKYVPHRIIKQDEVTLLQTKFNIVNPKEQLGWIDSQDASAKWIGARPGNIIEVIRFSQSSADARSWRYCVANTLDT